jgi:SAM-dependent methyltransferase
MADQNEIIAYDPGTLDFYAGEAKVYAAQSRQSPHLESFLALVIPGGRILELGCGAGLDSLAMIARGFDCDPTDGSPEMAAEAARNLGRPVAVMRFDELDKHEIYDGVWANACLLHVPDIALTGILNRIYTSIKPDAPFFASYKAGSQDGRDRFGRYYNLPSIVKLRSAYLQAGPWRNLEIDDNAKGVGYDGEISPWLRVLALR